MSKLPGRVGYSGDFALAILDVTVVAPPNSLNPPSPVIAEAPLYIRWGPDRSAYAIELRLDLVERIRQALVAVEDSETEIGGVLIGSLPTGYSSTLRIEDIELIARSPADGKTFMLDPGQHDRFAEIRWKTRSRDRVAVGLFRSHLRPGLLRPSLADRTLLSNEFNTPVYALLLVEGKDPHHAGIFVAAHGQLPVEPSVREFAWRDSDFRDLPEIDTESVAAPARGPARARRWFTPWAAVLMLLVLVTGAALVAFSARLGIPLPAWNGQPDVNLNVTASNRSIQITWNRQAGLIQRATAGYLSVRLPGEQRSISLAAAELQGGSVVIESGATGGEAALILDQPNSGPVRQTVFWHNP